MYVNIKQPDNQHYFGITFLSYSQGDFNFKTFELAPDLLANEMLHRFQGLKWPQVDSKKRHLDSAWEERGTFLPIRELKYDGPSSL